MSRPSTTGVRRIFEIDDWPRGADRALKYLDQFHDEFPGFRCHVFAIPEEMTDRDWSELLSRPWLRTGIHGFGHTRGECCRSSKSTMETQLDDVLRDDRWHRLFKAPWHHYNRAMFDLLMERDLTACTIGLNGVGYPVPGNLRIWNPCQAESGGIQCIGAHTDVGQSPSGRRTTLPRLVERGRLNEWLAEDQWCWIDEHIQPALKKLNLGCGSQIWGGWECLDPNDEMSDRIINWSWDQMLPYATCTVDVILISHSLLYCDSSKYLDVFLECWRVLQPLGVLRITEDETSHRIWRPAGTIHRTGTIRSEPTGELVLQALQEVGFQVYPAGPGRTRSPHKDVLQGDSRAHLWRRNCKFYLEAVKRIDIPNLDRASRYDPRATRKGRWRIPAKEGQDADSAR